MRNRLYVVRDPSKRFLLCGPKRPSIGAVCVLHHRLLFSRPVSSLVVVDASTSRFISVVVSLIHVQLCCIEYPSVARSHQN